MLTKEDYCDYDTCVALKELGYNQSSIAFYPCQDITVDCVDSNGDLYEAEYDKESLVLYSSLNLKNNKINKVQAPTLYEAQKWLRKEKGVIVGLHNNFTTREFKYYISTWEEDICTGKKYTDYEDALSDGIKEAVRLILGGKLCLD